MNTRFIELDSTYRDRNLWPLAGEFEVQISQTGRKGRCDAIDPVSLASPVNSWTSNEFNKGIIPSKTITLKVIDITSPVNFTSTSDTFIVEGDMANNLQEISNYYRSAVANDTTISEKRRILNYKYLGGNRAEITVDNSFSDSFNIGDTITISDPTDLTNKCYPLIFVPGGREGTNAYATSFIYNETLNEYRDISGYNFTTHLLEVDTRTKNSCNIKIDCSTSSISTISSGPVTGWSEKDNYSIRDEIPIYIGKVDTTNGISPVEVCPATTCRISLDICASSIDCIYNRQFLRITSGENKDEIRMITKYDGETRTVIVSPLFKFPPKNGDTIEILGFSYDNAVPFVYSGSLVSQQEEVCYEIQLINLVLPNNTLSVGRGSRIAFYPYVYVELVNVTGSNSGIKNIIYSNNPNSAKMLFRAVVNDNQNPLNTNFVKFNGIGMTQTVKFKPNDTLKFSVRLANGEIYDTVLQDKYSPFLPNDEVQISALFSIMRL